MNSSGIARAHVESRSSDSCFFLLLVSQTLSITLGKGSDMLEFLTHYFLSKVINNLQMWASESDVIKETGSHSRMRDRVLTTARYVLPF